MFVWGILLFCARLWLGTEECAAGSRDYLAVNHFDVSSSQVMPSIPAAKSGCQIWRPHVAVDSATSQCVLALSGSTNKHLLPQFEAGVYRQPLQSDMAA